MKFERAVLLVALTFASLMGCGDASNTSPTFAIATGGPAGLYYPFGGGMASIWSEHLPHVNVKAEVTGGSVTNVIQVARQESELGIAMADVVSNAYLGQGRFPEALPLRVLLNAYPNIVHILTLADSGITSVGDLVGRRVSLGAAGSGTSVAALNILGALGVEEQDISAAYLSFAETTSALKDGTIDAGFVVGGLGIAAVTELSVTRDLHLITLSENEVAAINSAHNAYSGYQIPAATYNGIDEPVMALGIWSAVVVHEDMPTQLAYQMVCTLFEHRQALLKVSPVARDLTVSNIGALKAVPLHLGSRRYIEHVAEGRPTDCVAGYE